jgi:hypothetical protein
MIAARGLFPGCIVSENHGLEFTASTSMKIENLFLKSYEVPPKPDIESDADRVRTTD